MTMLSALATMLHEEHRLTTAALGALEDRILGCDKNTPIDIRTPAERAEVQSLLEVLDQEVKRHFRFEDERLFPELDSRGHVELTRMLRQEHEAIRALAQAFEAVVSRALTEGFDRVSWQAYREAAMDLIPSVMFHIQKEETGVIQRLTFLIDGETDQTLATEYGRARNDADRHAGRSKGG